MSRPRALVPVLLLLSSLAAGCGGGGGGSSSRATAGVGSATPTTGTTAAPVVTAGPPGTLDPAFRQLVARAFAPQLRYNAYHNDGNASPQNRNEDFFPMGVPAFLAELDAGAARVLVSSARGPAASVSQVLPFRTRPTLRAARLEGYPRFMVGDEPGTAPTYVHVYEDPTARVLAPDGSGVLVVQAEYWFFYAYDRSEAVLIGFVTTASGDITGHRADWEGVSLRLEVRLGPGAVFAGGDVLLATYYGHLGGVVATPADLERVDDAGRDDPAGTHPVVYVSQGKHAAYPQAGEFLGHSVPTWLARHTDFFRGNGVRLDTWRTPLPDLEDAAAHPAEFAPQTFLTLAAMSPAAAVSGLPDWTGYRGRWGPDLTILNLPFLTLGVGLSPDGPKAKPKYGSFGDVNRLPRWSDVKRTEPGLKVYKERGITIPRVVPAPAPIRQ